MGARMGAMYRLKAYFGMVPAEELAEYADEPERYAPPVRRTQEPTTVREADGWRDGPAR